MDFSVKFSGFDPIRVKLDPNKTAETYYNLLVQSLDEEPVFRDCTSYNEEYFIELAKQARVALGWNIDPSEASIYAHKFLETLPDTNSFNNVPSEYDELVHNLHYCIHQKDARRRFIQIEWYNETFEPLDESFQHREDMSFGSLRLQNAYVGHIPLQVYKENDYEDVFRTCRFHDRIKPGVHIHLGEPSHLDWNNYKKWWHEKCPDFVQHHTWEKIEHYTGHPIIGKVINLNDLEKLNESDLIIFENIEI